MKRNIFRNLMGGLGLTTALFIFQACYGTPQDFMLDVLIEGKVTAKTSGEPIEGIRVSLPLNGQYQYTDASGVFSFYTMGSETISLRFEDVDSIQNGNYITRDTVLVDTTDYYFLDIQLAEQ